MRTAICVSAWVSVLAAVSLTSAPSSATTFVEEDFVCPIGGEKFTASVVASNSGFGARPDGKPYSPLPVYPVTECPDNGFLIFKKEWTDDELAALEEAIKTEEFQRIRKEETTYYRLWWLQKQINGDAVTLASNLMVAGWETDFNLPRKQRYQQAFVDAVSATAKVDNAEDWFWLNLRAANAQRELGQFDKSQAAFANLETEIAIAGDEETQSYVKEYIGGQISLIADQNTASEPANLVGESNAAMRCAVFEAELTASEKPICSSETVAQEIAAFSIRTQDGEELEGKAAARHMWRLYSQEMQGE